jgi:phosphoglycolate phosphatase
MNLSPLWQFLLTSYGHFLLNLFIFDLDGTLIDSALDLALSVNATRRHMGMPELDHGTINSYVGEGARVLLERAMGPGAPEETVSRALDFFLTFYRAHSLEHTKLYPGVREAIDELHARGKNLAVLTNKPVRISLDILAALGLGEKFFRVYGGNSFEQKKPDPIGVTTLMGETYASKEETMFVGDSGVDIRTARNAGVKACGVTWGFDPERMRAAQPDLIIDRMSELLAYA